MYKKPKILLVALYTSLPEDEGVNRFWTIANMLSKSYDVTLLTSRFSHTRKSFYCDPNVKEDFEIVFLDEPGYKKNVGIARVFSHKIFCNNFKDYLKINGHKFDLVYSAYPLIYTNFILGIYKKRYSYKLIIDVQDVWPESIKGPIPILSGYMGKIILWPLSKYADKAYSFADGLVAVSETYLKRADIEKLPKNKKVVSYIGTENELNCNTYLNNKRNFNSPLIVTYLGTMAGSYDLGTVIKAASLCKEKVQIRMIGSGPHEKKLQKLNRIKGNNVKFLGVYPYNEAMTILSESDIAINPIKSMAQQSITNKLSDYLSCGIPILSCQQNPEVINILRKGGNIQYEPSNAEDLAQKLLYIEKNRALLNDISKANFKIAQKCLVRGVSYLDIMELVDSIIDSE